MANVEDETGEYRSEEEKQAAEQFEKGNEVVEDPKITTIKDRIKETEEQLYGLIREVVRSKRENGGDLTNDELNKIKKQDALLDKQLDSTRAKIGELKMDVLELDPDAFAVKIPYPVKVSGQTSRAEAEQQDKQYSRAESEKSRQGVDDAYWKMRYFELNGDPDDLTEARNNYDKLSKEYQARSKEVKRDEWDFDEQMRGR